MASNRIVEAAKEVSLEPFPCRYLTQNIMFTSSSPNAKVSGIPGGINKKILCCDAKSEALLIKARCFLSGAKKLNRSNVQITTITVNRIGTKKRAKDFGSNWNSFIKATLPT